MATPKFAIRRQLLIGAFVVAAAAAPAIAAFSMPEPGIAQAQCTGGEEADQFTTTCVPYLVPNSGGSGFTTTAANPDMPEIDGIPCTGGNSGACIGLSEDQSLLPNVTPRSTISSSP
ncbi:intersectin-EH binding protein Ibp1 [Mycobacterium sp. 2YAF39]|uniref:intersectin-EH binding protein Ibp1 n=1 Tax=Mycobacterium sp. 2YAF39 TaxID=3233033 RepID=UPI003F9D7961